MQPKIALIGRSRRLITAGMLVAIGIGTTGCASLPAPVNKPCGVIHDSLQDVTATTAGGNDRLAIHYARGHANGCW